MMNRQSASPIREIHESLYFPDGNVVLFAQRSHGECVVFRVHQSMLSGISPVFATMFQLPPGDTVETYDGVPSVCLPDAADDIECLLKVLYHETPLPFKRLDPCTPLVVRQILQLANKYSMDHFRHRIVEHIELDWPRSLYQWDILEAEIRSIRALWHLERRIEPHDQLALIDDHLPEPASAIRLARDCDIPSILPAAFYHLSRLSPVYDDWHNLRQDSNEDSRRTARWELLAAEDFLCLIKGRERLTEAVTDMQFSQVYDAEDHCSVDCNASERRKVCQDIRDQCLRSRDILLTARRLQEKITYGQICGLCVSSVRQELTRFRRQLWLQLPDIFALT